MRKLTSLIIIGLLLAIAACYHPQQTVKTANKPEPPAQPVNRQVNDKYILTTLYGHKLEIEMDYAVGQNGYINNGCKAQYIITNIGTKELVEGEHILTGKSSRVGTDKMGYAIIDSSVIVSSVVFEFQTSDGKGIEASESLFRHNNRRLPTGKSTEAETVSINAGSRSCISVKPIRIEVIKSVKNRGNSIKKK